VQVALISDVHGNLAALESVLDALADRCDEIWCLGDTVGYGAKPNECVALVRERCSVVLAGNHDLAAIGTVDPAVFSHDAGRAIRWTREVLDPDAEAWLRTLEPRVDRGPVILAHGSPRNPVWEYIMDAAGARAALEGEEALAVAVGHTHAAMMARLGDGALTGGAANAGATFDLDAVRSLINPGSVGQPRDADARAAYALLTLGDEGVPERVVFQRTPYSIGRTQREIREAGLPEHLADRLSFGM
jgi:diadenosine tetraphosphatase ApaH/serine/threonine PP2A family protein phosphatase